MSSGKKGADMSENDRWYAQGQAALRLAVAQADITKRTPGEIRYDGDWLETADGHRVTKDFAARGAPNRTTIAVLNDGEYIEYPDKEVQHANGKFLALAWNTHDALVEALRLAVGYLEAQRTPHAVWPNARKMEQAARAALALVDGEKGEAPCA